MKVDGYRFSIYLDGKGNIQRMVLTGREFELPLKYTLYEIDGRAAYVSEARIEGDLSFRLTTERTAGRFILSPGKEVRMRFEAEQGDSVENVSIVIPFPIGTEFHLPEGYNLARKIDRKMPIGEGYSAELGYNFFLVNVQDMWVRFLVRRKNIFQRCGSAKVHISRHPEVFIVTLTWGVEDDAFLAVFPSMGEAIGDYETWLEKGLGVKKLRERPDVPKWVHNVRLVLIMDMMRSNWEISHNYEDVANLAEELKHIGCPKDTLFYIPGWNGAYDSTYPTYQPHPELGGEEKFREMIETLHKNDFRVMIHTNAWGVDPYHPEIDRYLKYVLRDENGDFAGFQTGTLTKWGIMAPPSRSLKFVTDKIRIPGVEGARSLTFKTVYVPDRCEALFTVGGLKVGKARVRFTVGRRSITTPPDWFKTHDGYDLPFPLLLEPGVNEVHVEVMGDAEPDWSQSWYRIRYAFVPLNPYTSWTHPILFADTADPGWIEIFVGNVGAAVREYGIDAVHVDATEYEWNKAICTALRERLPDIPLSGEGFATLSGMGFWTFVQSPRCQSLLGHLDVMRGTCQQGALPDTSKIEEHYEWLNEESPVSNFVGEYVKIYPHLCAADAFVPVGKVCNTFPPRLSPRCGKLLWKVLRDVRRLNYIPALRLNYREYGLDEETKRAIRELFSER
jgi:hypothetical protein